MRHSIDEPRNLECGELVYSPALYDKYTSAIDDLPFYEKWLKAKGGKALELCCGSGRLTIPLAQRKVAIVGVDNSSAMLKAASKRAEQEGLDLRFVEADVRRLNLSERFDVVFIPLNSIQHMLRNEDLSALLKVVRRHLKKDGVFIFDCMNPDLKFLLASQGRRMEIARFATEDGEDVILSESMVYDAATQINEIKLHFEIAKVERPPQLLPVRMFFPQEMDHFLECSRLQIVHKFGSFEESGFAAQCRKQIYVCKPAVFTRESGE